MNPIDKVLSRLEKVKQTNTHRWTALCPHHEDKSPSLSINEKTDGKVTIKCWAGCHDEDVLGTMGLEIKDLYPKETLSINFTTERHKVSAQQARDISYREFSNWALLEMRSRTQLLTEEELDSRLMASQKLITLFNEAYQ